MKTTILSIKSAFVLMSLGISMISIAQTEVLLGQYTFDSGSKSATNVVPNITFDDIIAFTNNTSTFYATYGQVTDRSCVTLYNSNNTLAPKKGIVLPITPASGKTFVITRMEIIHKGDALALNALCWIDDTYGTTDTSTSSSTYFFGPTTTTGFKNLASLTDWTVESFNVVNSDVANPTKCIFTAKKYVLLSFGCKGSGPGNWFIDDIKIFGYEQGTTTETTGVQKLQNSIIVLSDGIEVNVDRTTRLNIYTITGASVSSQEIIGKKSIKLSKGIYVARLSDNKNNIVKKLIVK